MPEEKDLPPQPMLDADFDRLKIYALALCQLKDKIDTMIRQQADAQEDLEHQGVFEYPLALQKEVSELTERIRSLASRFKSPDEKPTWGECMAAIVDTKALIGKIDPDNKVLSI